MIEKAINKILDLAPIETTEVDGREYSRAVDALRQITPPHFVSPDALIFKTLSGMVDYVKSNHSTYIEGLRGSHPNTVLLQVDDYNKVTLRGHLQPENSNKRFKYAESVLAIDRFSFSVPINPVWHDLENFVIALQSQFVQTDKIEELISHLSHLANETVVDVKDDTFSQSYQIKTGITTKSSVVVTNPITLQPHRTFSEIEQPESTCIFRLKGKGEMQCALFISDGGAWEIDAINNIKEWLQGQLPDITIIA